MTNQSEFSFFFNDCTNSNNNLIINSNNHFELTAKEIEEEIKNSQNFSSVSKLNQIISLFGIIICIFGITGHLFSIIVLCKKKMKKLSTYSYLLALSICDEISLILTVLIFLENLIPFFKLNLSRNIINSHKIILIYIEPITVSSQALSVWITLAFTIDRYLYCCQPYIGHKYCTRKRASIVIIMLYLMASIYSIPQFFERTYKIECIIDVPFVVPVFTDIGTNYYFRSIYQIFFYSAFVVLIPFTIILILNVFLIYDIIKSNKRHRKMSQAFKTSIRHQQESESNSKVNFIRNLIYKNKSQLKPNETKTNETEHLNGSAHKENIVKAKKHSLISNRSIFNITEKSLRNDVTIMLIGLIVVFFICLTPSTILRLITYKNQKILFEKLYALFLDISNLLVVCNSTLNCIMYVMLGKKFREQFLKAFCPKIYRKKIKNSLFNIQRNETNLNHTYDINSSI